MRRRGGCESGSLNRLDPRHDVASSLGARLEKISRVEDVESVHCQSDHHTIEEIFACPVSIAQHALTPMNVLKRI